jgi:ribosome modulation factor
VDDPFDARKVMFNDREQPAQHRRTVSLVTALRAAVLESVHGASEGGDQAAYLRQVADELTARGIDGDCIVRYGLCAELIVAVVVRTLPHWMPALRALGGTQMVIEQDDPAPQALAPWPHAETWEELLGPRVEREVGVSPADGITQSNIHVLIRSISSAALPWTLSASLNDLLALKPSTDEQLQHGHDAVAPEMETAEDYRWVVDRFSTTHLSDWSTSSLYCEYKWRQGICASPCREELMDDRVVDDQCLNAEIARRAVVAEPKKYEGDPAGLNRTLFSKLSSSAVDLLRIGRFREAAALFEFAVSESPHNPELLNNLGFCLIPDDPRRALDKLEEASQRGYTHRGINLCNRAMCKFLLGDARAALHIIDEAWAAIPTDTAVLWRPGPHGLELQEQAALRDELAYLAYRAAKSVDDGETAERWAQLAFNED